MTHCLASQCSAHALIFDAIHVGGMAAQFLYRENETMLHLLDCTSFSMGKICQIIVSGIKAERKIIDVANSEDEFNKTTILAFKEKLMLQYPELRGRLFLFIVLMT